MDTIAERDGASAACAKNDKPPNDDGIIAQKFPPPPYDVLTSFAAADFKLSRRCNVTSVYVNGINDAIADRIIIWIYKNTADDLPSRPGTSKCSAVRRAPGPDFLVPVSDCSLKKGHYWLAVQVDQLCCSDYWEWATTNSRIGLRDAWRNPGDGWETGCTEWATNDTCHDLAYDYLFSIT